MDIFFLIIVLAALAHFIYQGIISPSLRMCLRYKLFAMRDKLRLVRLRDGENCDQEAYSLLQSRINNLIIVFADLDFGLLARAEYAMSKDPALKARAERRYAVLSACDNKEIREIFEESRMICYLGFALNSLPIVIYLTPLVACYSSAKRLANAVVAVPEGELPKIYSQPALSYS